MTDTQDPLTQALESPDASIVQAMSGLYASMYGATSVAEGSTYYLSLSPIANGTIASWTVYWGDGTASYGITSSPATHVYRDGTTVYGIQGTAYAGTTAVPASSRQVTVQNVAPSITATGTDLGGHDYQVDVVKLYDPGLDTVKSWRIDWGDDTTSTVSGEWGSAIHSYEDCAEYTVQVTAYDEDGSYLAAPLRVMKWTNIDHNDILAAGAGAGNPLLVTAGQTAIYRSLIVTDPAGVRTTANLKTEVYNAGVPVANVTVTPKGPTKENTYSLDITVPAGVAPGTNYSIKVTCKGALSPAWVYVQTR